ncbi:MAG: FAD-dependent monooxygenase [Betaproteobacteria bacterium]
MSHDFDIAIVGAGPVGAAVAIALRDAGLSVALLEARTDAAVSDDARTLAMSYGSRLILERLGIWARIASATPITSIHVSQRGGFGRTVLDASEADVPALGYVVRYAALQRAFGAALGETQAALLAGATVAGVTPTDDGISIEYAKGAEAGSVTARLLVIADGGGVAGVQAGAEIKTQDYDQHALVGLVGTSRPHTRRAFERFTPDGPVALLPFEDRYALIWTATPEEAQRLIALPSDEFLLQLQRHFGDRAGRFESIDARARFPLALRYATDPVLERTVMLGNAAQSLHPIAGQGFNLGLRDAWELADILFHSTARDPGSDECLARYRKARRPDRMRGIALTHSLVKIFSNDVGPLRATRGAALSMLGLFPLAKRAFMQRMIFGASR